MNKIDSQGVTPPPVRPGRAAPALAAVIVALSVLFITLVAVPSPQVQQDSAQASFTAEPSRETFTAIGTFAPASPSATPATPDVPTASTSTAPGTSATPVLDPSPIADPDHVATRVRVPALRIDLAVVAPPRDQRSYPKCGVAMYLAQLHQPGENGATYLYAHARTGMFLPIYERAIQRLHDGPRSMLGMSVEVFTSDNLRYLYTIKEVRVHQTSLGDAARTKAREVWLQTSEGPKGTRGKTQVRAVQVGVGIAAAAQAHPPAKPVTCG